jgi:inositol phosphorylceramide mannosyltransferase catalytic subunit
MSATIPRILHQTWRTAELPQPFKAWRAGWMAHHPDWEHRLYDDDLIYRTIADRAPQWLSIYRALPRAIQRADFFRYVIVFLDGGLYADIDTVSYRASDELLGKSSCVLGTEMRVSRESQALFGYSQPLQFANFIFAAAPRHPFLEAVIEEIARVAARPIINDDSIQETTGPRMFTRVAYSVMQIHRISITILPRINWNAPLQLPRIGPLADCIYARHLCFGSWRTENVAWRRFARGLRRVAEVVN